MNAPPLPECLRESLCFESEWNVCWPRSASDEVDMEGISCGGFVPEILPALYMACTQFVFRRMQALCLDEDGSAVRDPEAFVGFPALRGPAPVQDERSLLFGCGHFDSDYSPHSAFCGKRERFDWVSVLIRQGERTRSLRHHLHVSTVRVDA